MFRRKKKNAKSAGDEIEKTRDDDGTESDYVEEEEEQHHSLARDNNDMILYVLCDNVTDKFRGYVSNTGLNVCKIFSNIEDVRDELLIEYRPYRLVVVDTGAGKFTGIQARKDITDLIGIMDEDGRASVIYTDEALRYEIKSTIGRKEKEVQWEKYRGTLDMVTDIKKLGEEYTSGKKIKAEVDSEIKIGYKGSKVKSDKAVEKFRYVDELVTPKQWVKGMRSSDYAEYVKGYVTYI